MKPAEVFHVIDSHTAGEPTRLLQSGIPALAGRNMKQKQRSLQRRFDRIRTTLTQEPRGTPGVLALLLPPCDPAADYGLIFADYRGYVDMCIHGTIGVVTTLIECGLVGRDRAAGMTFDTPAGIVRAIPNFSRTRLESVTVTNVPSHLVGETEFNLPGLGRVRALLAYGGNLYAYLDAKDIDLEIVPSSLARALSIARSFFVDIDSRPGRPHGRPGDKVVGISLYEDLGRNRARNIMIARNDLYDRSPCGTGTSGRMAILAHQGRLGPSEEFVNESITGSRFTGRIASQVVSNRKVSIIPEITGTAHITSFSDIMVDEMDEFAHGFRIG